MEVQYIWISSVSHLEELAEIYKKTGLWKRLSGDFAVPDEFPQIRTQQSAIPLIYFSSGSLDLLPDKAVFKSFPQQGEQTVSSSVYKNIPQDVCLDINYNSIVSIELYNYPQTNLKPLNIQWIRILTKDHILGGDFLLCAAENTNPPKACDSSTQDLYKQLIDLTIDTIN